MRREILRMERVTYREQGMTQLENFNIAIKEGEIIGVVPVNRVGLAAFIRLYKPAYFQRVGLRYVNVFSRARLGLEDASWTELFAPAYTAPMQEPDAAEDRFLNCGCDLTLKLDSSCRAKIHAGPGVVKRNAPGAPQDPEVKFLFDMDLSMNGNTPCTLAAGALETLHGHSTRLFEGAITDRLRDALDAE